jgi:hypothetical protein
MTAVDADALAAGRMTVPTAIAGLTAARFGCRAQVPAGYKLRHVFSPPCDSTHV